MEQRERERERENLFAKWRTITIFNSNNKLEWQAARKGKCPSMLATMNTLDNNTTKLDGQGRARCEAARCRKSESIINLDILNSSRSSASKRLQKLYPRTTWRMHSRQLTAYEHFGCVNMRAITFLFVDQSSSRDSRPHCNSLMRIFPLAWKL